MEAALPTWIVLAVAEEPILIAPVLASVPNPIEPADESIVILLVVWTSTVAPSIFKLLPSSEEILATFEPLPKASLNWISLNNALPTVPVITSFVFVASGTYVNNPDSSS